MVGYALILCLACFIVVHYLCVTWMANIINVPYTWVYRRLFFLYYPRDGDCKYPIFPCFFKSLFFDDANRGKIKMPMLICVIPWMSWLSWKKFLCYCLLLCKLYPIQNWWLFSWRVNMVIWFVNVKKEEFVEPILIRYKVLMITNTNAIYTWVCWSNRLNIVFVLHWNCFTNLT